MAVDEDTDAGFLARNWLESADTSRKDMAEPNERILSALIGIGWAIVDLTAAQRENKD